MRGTSVAPRLQPAMPVQLNYRDYGAGPPLLVLHGLFGSAGNWRSVARELGRQRRVYTLDLRNHGDSPHAPAMDYDSMAGDLLAFMQREGLERAAVLGHSMGGKAAMRFALTHPERVERLVVVDVAPAASEEDHSPLIDAMQNLDLSGLQRRSDADDALAASIPESGVRMFLLQNLVADDGGFRWRIHLDAIERGLPDIRGWPDTPAGAAYAGPVLFVRGGRSSYVRDEHEAVIRKLFPDVRLVSVAQAGHWVHADQPARFVEVVRDFLGG